MWCVTLLSAGSAFPAVSGIRIEVDPVPANCQCFTDVEDSHREADFDKGDHSRRNIKRFCLCSFKFVRNRRIDSKKLPAKPFEGFFNRFTAGEVVVICARAFVNFLCYLFQVLCFS